MFILNLINLVDQTPNPIPVKIKLLKNPLKQYVRKVRGTRHLLQEF